MELLAHLLSIITGLLFALVPSVGHGAAYVAQPFLPSKPEAAIIFGGDMMFDRTVRTTIDKKGGDFVFSCIEPVLQNADLVVANLEGPITTSASISATSTPGDEFNYTFTFPMSTAALLFAHNIHVVNIGNNHILNFGRDGLAQTKAALNAAGVKYFGDPDSAESDRVLRIDVQGVAFSFVNWSDWTSDKTDHTVAQVRTEAESGRIVVVYTHWGEEYVPALPRVKELAHEFVDAGAAIVIGSHPHVIQEHEEYRGKHIYYSLGNFIFDQYWNEAVRTGLLLKVSFDTAGVRSVDEIPVHLEHDRTTCPIPQST